MRRLPVLVVAVVLAGCSGFGGPAAEDAAPRATAVTTPAPVPTDRPAAYPPGVSESGVNATALAAAHERALRGSSYRWQLDRQEARPEPGLGTVYVGPRITATVNDPRRYAVVRAQVTSRGGGLTVETRRSTRVAFGDRVFVRDGNSTRTRNLTANDTGQGARLAGRYVARYLAVENASVVVFENGTALVDGEGSLAVEGREYSVTAYVGPDGVVRRFEATYAREDRARFASYEVSRGAQQVTPPSVLNGTASGAV